MIFEKEINNRFVGMRLDVYLTEKFTYHTRNQWQKLIENGQVLLNHKTVKPSARIPADSILHYDIGDYIEPPANENYSILYEDQDLMAVNKPPNIPVHTSGKYFNNTLIKVLRRDFPNLDLDLINRLDRETSGIILLSKSALARKVAGELFKRKEVQKTYIAYVFGEVEKETFTVDAPIAEDVSTVVRIRMGIDEQRGLSAQTDFSIVKLAKGFTKLLCHPITGRTNQIRVHLSHIGHPVIGDKLYSGNDKDFLEFIEKGNTPEILSRVLTPRQLLHAYRNQFTHPVTGQPLDLVCPEPDDMIEFEKGHFS